MSRSLIVEQIAGQQSAGRGEEHRVFMIKVKHFERFSFCNTPHPGSNNASTTVEKLRYWWVITISRPHVLIIAVRGCH